MTARHHSVFHLPMWMWMRVTANRSLSTHPAELASNRRSRSVESTSLKPISRLRSSRILQQVWGGFFDSHFGSEMTQTHAESEASLCRFFNGLWDTWFRTRNSVSAPWYIHSKKVLFYRFSVPKADSSREKSLQTFRGKRLNKILRNRQQETTRYSDFYICCERTLRWHRRGHWFNPSRAHHFLPEMTLKTQDIVNIISLFTRNRYFTNHQKAQFSGI